MWANCVPEIMSESIGLSYENGTCLKEEIIMHTLSISKIMFGLVIAVAYGINTDSYAAECSRPVVQEYNDGVAETRGLDQVNRRAAINTFA